MQSGYQRTGNLAATGVACSHELCKRRLHPREVRQSGANIGQPERGESGRLTAMGAILELQQLADLIQAKAQALSGLHELQPRDVRLAIAANAAVGTARFEQQALALIETDRLDIDPGGSCEGTDSQILDYFFHFA